MKLILTVAANLLLALAALAQQSLVVTSAANFFATSRPIPEVPPVTNAFLPSSSISYFLPSISKVDCAIQTGTQRMDCQIHNEC